MLSVQGSSAKHGARLVHAARPHDEHGVLAVNVAYRPAERNLAVIAEPIDAERSRPPSRQAGVRPRVGRLTPTDRLHSLYRLSWSPR
jgi:hypothetical protein